MVECKVIRVDIVIYMYRNGKGGVDSSEYRGADVSKKTDMVGRDDEK